ncbi:MAG: ABC transporter ATP-binding protein [Proteobacteria bacterium]|nr:ABC transporter ATP-binding protein [Pseudomonadota bacterium]MBU1569654.1 ABC transporter ATP-binding protein [Pseudomonadota bacterium]
MSSIVIKAENLGKKYVIGHQAERGNYTALRDVLMQNARTLWSKTKDLAKGKPVIQGDTMEEVWALKDVSFEISRGEAVGIIGRNGAGKSTLLKILSRITEPTEGRVTIRGRVASLLEVGTGFHPELSGRENIYLNGTILGMTRLEIKRKFDEIVAFAEVEKYLDTPVKRYSSGMYVRLAFAVAAHLEPEILVVDEVLAVGDASFQKKCLGKMGDVAKEGRTVLFVSHNMAAVRQLCQNGMVLNEGKVNFLGDIGSTINRYLQDVKTVQAVSLAERRDRQGSQWLKFTGVRLFNTAGNEQRQAISGQDVFIRFYYVSDKVMRDASVNIAFNVRSNQGCLLTNLNSLDVEKTTMNLYSTGFLQCFWPRFSLRSGSYECALFCAVNGDIVDWLQSAFTIQVEDGDFFSTGRIINREQGDVLFSYDWASHPIEG